MPAPVRSRSRRRVLFAAAALVAAGAAAAPARAGTIDTTGGVIGGSTITNATLGGTFTADDARLESFSMLLRSFIVPNMVAGVVYATDGGGVPTGAPIWTETPFLAPAGFTDTLHTSTPGISITPGQRYFIGYTINPVVVPGVSGGGSVTIRTTTSDVLAGGNLFLGVGATPTFAMANDFYGTVVMNPEPGTMALFGVGAAGLAVMVRRRRRARAVAAR